SNRHLNCNLPFVNLMQYNERHTFNTSPSIQGGMNLLYIIGVIMLFFLVYYLIQKKIIFVQTVSGAIVMALGVFSLNVGPHFGQNTAWYKSLPSLQQRSGHSVWFLILLLFSLEILKNY